MKKTTKYRPAPASLTKEIADSKIVEDFLPPPEELFLNEAVEKITINLSKSSILFFKNKAKELRIPYQQMIKKVVDIYARKYA